jgi:hypothetical protein
VETRNLREKKDIKDPRLERLIALQRRQTKAPDWTEEERKELLGLQKSLHQPINMTQAHYDSLKRQYTAGMGNNPPLTAREQQLIREVNSVT